MRKFEQCKWCDGSGNDSGGYNACPDCESTGLVGGRGAYEAMEQEIEKSYEEYKMSVDKLIIEKVLGWKENYVDDDYHYLDNEDMTVYSSDIRLSPTEDIKSAWFVMSKVSEEKEWRFIISHAPHWKETEVTAKGRMGSPINMFAKHGSASMAISLAILNAYGLYVDGKLVQ